VASDVAEQADVDVDIPLPDKPFCRSIYHYVKIKHYAKNKLF
jgi:hypothetical protein